MAADILPTPQVAVVDHLQRSHGSNPETFRLGLWLQSQLDGDTPSSVSTYCHAHTTSFFILVLAWLTVLNFALGPAMAQLW